MDVIPSVGHDFKYEKRMDAVLVVACRPWWAEIDARTSSTLLGSLFERLSQLAWVDRFVVWTKVDDLLALARKMGFDLIAQKADMETYPVHAESIPKSWKDELGGALRKLRGSAGNVQVYLDADHILFNHLTLEKMFDSLMEDETAHQVTAAYPIEPHLYLDTKKGLRQLYDAVGVDRQALPQLYRRCAVTIRHALRPQAGIVREILHPVSWNEGFAYRTDYEGFFLEQAWLVSKNEASP